MLLLILKLQREQLCAGSFELYCYHLHDDSGLNVRLAVVGLCGKVLVVGGL